MSERENNKYITTERLLSIYKLLLSHFGRQFWWPAEDRDEVIIGAILTQNTNWTNVTKAIDNLKKAQLCSLGKLVRRDTTRIAELIKPSGYYNLKAVRLKHTAEMLRNWQPDSNDIPGSRQYLLSIKGIGPETADSILLYAFGLPVFVIDSYTTRLFSRLINIPAAKNYHFYQDLFMSRLKEDSALYNEYHALIIQQGKKFCRKTPYCSECPLRSTCYFSKTK